MCNHGVPFFSRCFRTAWYPVVFVVRAATHNIRKITKFPIRSSIHSSFSIFAEAIGAGTSRDARAFFFLLACAGFLRLVKRGEKNRERERERARVKIDCATQRRRRKGKRGRKKRMVGRKGKEGRGGEKVRERVTRQGIIRVLGVCYNFRAFVTRPARLRACLVTCTLPT